MTRKTLSSFAMLGLFAALGVAAPVGIDIAAGSLTMQSAEARRGRSADDNPATHDVADDNGGTTGGSTSSSSSSSNQRRRGRNG